jgi:hypothetical protein
MEIPYKDLVRDFVNCVVMYKNKPVYIQTVTPKGLVLYTDLLTQKTGEAVFTLKAFSSPLRRLGYVNIGLYCAYLTRNPFRKFFMGLNRGNTTVSLPNIDFKVDVQALMAGVRALTSPEVGKAILDTYPTFKQACTQVKTFGGICAFDKQFAIHESGAVYYKNVNVGKSRMLVRGTVADIQFNEGHRHLAKLFRNTDEKAA